MSKKYLHEIHLRDPFILADACSKMYYLYGSIGENVWEGKAVGFDVYVSEDLDTWEGPLPVFRPTPDFWYDRHFWAPEVYYLQERYYMFASFKAEDAPRVTGVLVANHPIGPFKPYVKSLTPQNWECLDGTLFEDENGERWLVFCREWIEVKDGEMYAVLLSFDLSVTMEEPILLFKASNAPWACGFGETKENYVTDGPFLYRLGSGELIMLWSTVGEEGYTMGLARSTSGTIKGPWIQEKDPLFAKNGGHGMLFSTFDGELHMTIHTPNQHPDERPFLFKVMDEKGTLHIKSAHTGKN